MNYTTTRKYWTKDYSIFIHSPHNRDVKKIRQLEESMRKYGYDDGFPIRCRPAPDGKLYCTHGHTRLYVAASLGLPVWFVVASADIPMFESETANHNWTVTDYAVARERAGEHVAGVVMALHRETGIGLNQCISLVGGESAGSNNKRAQLKNGTLKQSNMKHANQIKDVVLFLKEIGCSFATNNYFVAALSKCFLVPTFDAATFMHKCRTHKEIMEPRRNVEDYLDLIELVYNRQTPKRAMIPLAFMAKQISLQKKASFGRV